MAKKPEWTNDLIEPTPREQHLADLAEKAKEVKPQSYTIESRNLKATRVVYDYYGEAVTIPPGERKEGIALRPDTAEYLGKGDLTLTAA